MDNLSSWIELPYGPTSSPISLESQRCRRASRLVADRLDLVGGVEAHQIQQTAGGVLEGRVGVRVRLSVVLVALPIQIERQFGDLLIGQVGIPRIEYVPAGCFLSAGSQSLLQTLLDGAQLRIHVTVATYPSGVEHAQGRNRLEALVGLRRGQRVPAATADAEQAQALPIDASVLGEEVRHAMDVLDTVGGFVHVARLAATGTLIGRIGGNRYVALLRQALGIQARDLFLHPTIRVRHDDCGIFLRRVIVRGGVDVGGNLQTVELVCDRVDVNLARFVLGDRAVIGRVNGFCL